MSTQVVIRGISPLLLDKMKEVASQNHRSLESELRMVIEEKAHIAWNKSLFLEELQDFQQRLASPTFTDSVNLVRQDRSQ